MGTFVCALCRQPTARRQVPVKLPGGKTPGGVFHARLACRACARDLLAAATAADPLLAAVATAGDMGVLGDLLEEQGRMDEACCARQV